MSPKVPHSVVAPVGVQGGECGRAVHRREYVRDHLRQPAEVAAVAVDVPARDPDRADRQRRRTGAAWQRHQAQDIGPDTLTPRRRIHCPGLQGARNLSPSRARPVELPASGGDRLDRQDDAAKSVAPARAHRLNSDGGYASSFPIQHRSTSATGLHRRRRSSSVVRRSVDIPP